MTKFKISDRPYTLTELYQCIQDRPKIILDESIVALVNKSRNIVDEVVESDKIIYGINTGFGKLSQVVIDKEDIKKLQYNLIVSHAVGVGEPVDDDIVWMMLLLKIISLAKGYSGVRIELLSSLTSLINSGYLPIIPSQGSVGASGDLAQLAHLVLPLIGLGDIQMRNKIYPSSSKFKDIIKLSYKEGLALINGTQYSNALALIALKKIQNIIKIADIAGAMSIEGLNGTDEAFRADIQQLKAHRGQLRVAKNLRVLLKNSEIHNAHKDCDRVQDMYSLRCMPQVHGASRDTIEYISNIIEQESNSISDNPIVLPKSEEIVSSGHFHGEALAQALDCAAIAITGFGTISERRIFNLLDGKFGLPPFLVENPGLNSGFMMLQVTAAALVSENKTLSHPASVDSIPTGAGQEDHVSMSPWAGRKLLQIIDNIESIFAIEFIVASQAIDYRNGLKPAEALIPVQNLLRENIPKLNKDRMIIKEIDIAKDLVKSGKIVSSIKSKQILN